MIRRILDDPWRCYRHMLLLALVVATVGMAYALSVDDRPVVYMEREYQR